MKYWCRLSLNVCFCVFLNVWLCSLYLLFMPMCACVCDGGTAVGANGFTERNTAGHDVSRGVKATVGQRVCACVYVC